MVKRKDAPPAGGCVSAKVLAALLPAHSKFFDHLVELVPPRYYHSLDADRVNTKFMKKADKAAAKQAFRKQGKQEKKEKLDPATATTSLGIQRQRAAEAARERSGGDSNGAAPQAERLTDAASPTQQQQQPALRLDVGGIALSKEELRARLAKKVEAMRQLRHAEERQKKADSAKALKEKALKKSRDKERAADRAAVLSGKKPQQQQKERDGGEAVEGVQRQTGGVKRKAEAPEGEEHLSFGKIEVDSGSKEMFRKDLKSKKKRKMSKDELLLAAEAKRELKEAALADPEARDTVQREAWGAALARAKGERVLDDPKRLRRSIKMDAKAKEKRVGAWKERAGKQKEAQAAKQQKRVGNLKARADGVIERKKAKREKKLLRPGFEGRKAGFIKSPSGRKG